jgi:hypothetical protein
MEEKAKRDRAELEQRAFEFHHAQTERFKKLAGGPDTLPLDQALEKIETEYPTSGYDKTIDDFVESLGLEKYSTATSRLSRAVEFDHAQTEHFKKLANGADTFPLAETLKKIKGSTQVRVMTRR